MFYFVKGQLEELRNMVRYEMIIYSNVHDIQGYYSYHSKRFPHKISVHSNMFFPKWKLIKSFYNIFKIKNMYQHNINLQDVWKEKEKKLHELHAECRWDVELISGLTKIFWPKKKRKRKNETKKQGERWMYLH